MPPPGPGDERRDHNGASETPRGRPPCRRPTVWLGRESHLCEQLACARLAFTSETPASRSPSKPGTGGILFAAATSESGRRRPQPGRSGGCPERPPPIGAFLVGALTQQSGARLLDWLGATQRLRRFTHPAPDLGRNPFFSGAYPRPSRTIPAPLRRGMGCYPNSIVASAFPDRGGADAERMALRHDLPEPNWRTHGGVPSPRRGSACATGSHRTLQTLMDHAEPPSDRAARARRGLMYSWVSCGWRLRRRPMRALWGMRIVGM
jgi:hypothetical protein